MKKLGDPDTARIEMITSLRFTAVLALLATPACIKTFDLDGDDTGSTSSSGEDPTATAGSSLSTTTQAVDESSTSTTGDADVDGSGTSTTLVDTGDESTTGDVVPSVCDPQPEVMQAWVRIASPKLEAFDVLVDAPCEVAEYEQVDPNFGVVRLVCAEPGGPTEHNVEIHADPFFVPALETGDTVHMRAASQVNVDTPGWNHIVIRDEADSIVLATYDFRQQPPDVDPLPWFLPFGMALDVDVCDPEPYADVEPTNFITDPCPEQIERAAVALTSPWGDALVYDRTTAQLGAYEVRVPWAHTAIPQGDPATCSQLPFREGHVVLVRTK